MRPLLLKSPVNLLCVKSIVTIVLTIVFAYLSSCGKISGQSFLTIFSVIIAFYFGTQSQKGNEKIENIPEKDNNAEQSNANQKK